MSIIGLSVSIVVAVFAQVCLLLIMLHDLRKCRKDDSKIYDDLEDGWEDKRKWMYNLEDTANIKLVAAKGGKRK